MSVSCAIHDLVERSVDLVVLCAHGMTGNGSWNWPYGSVARNYIEYGAQTALVIQMFRAQDSQDSEEIAAEKYGAGEHGGGTNQRHAGRPPSTNPKPSRTTVLLKAGRAGSPPAARPLRIFKNLSIYADWLAEAHIWRFAKSGTSPTPLNGCWTTTTSCRALREIGEPARGYYNRLPGWTLALSEPARIAASALLAHMHTMVSMEDLEGILIELRNTRR